MSRLFHCPRCRAKFEPLASYLMSSAGGNVYSCNCPQCEFMILGMENDESIDWDTETGVAGTSQFEATVSKTGPNGTRLPIGGWMVIGDDGKEFLAYLTAKVQTTKIPTLQLGDKILVREMTDRRNACSIQSAGAPMIWVSSSRSERMNQSPH